MKIEDMLEELTIYYEAAGFMDIYEKELKQKTEEEIRQLYRITFEEVSKNNE